MARIARLTLVVALFSLPVLAQTNADLSQAQQVLELANSAGAQQYAKSLYDDAAYRIRFAQENMNSPKANMQEQARMRARESLYAARAALAKARWAGTNAAIRNLQADITRFGGRSDLRLQDEDPNLNYGRGSTSKERIAAAQAAIDQARAAGAEQSVADNDLKTAQGSVDSANKVSRNGRDNSEVADHLAYVAEMIARRAYYVARFSESSRSLPDIQLQRTRLAQASSEQQAAAERVQREEAERRAAELQAQLASQEANRQAQAAEVERLRQQVDENRRAMAQRIESDRRARLEAEAALDAAMTKYEADPANDSLRRQVEDAEIALKTVQDRERLNQEAMASDINTLRNDVQNAQSLDPAVLSQRQADVLRRQNDLDQFRAEREADVARRADIQRRHEAAITSARAQRQAAEQQAQEMKAQIEAAQLAAQQAAAAAQAAQESAQKQAEQNKAALEAAQQQALQQEERNKQALEAAQKQAEQQAAEAEKARAESRRISEELEKTRADMQRQLAEQKAAEDRRRMEAELARLAQTKRESRGLVVTLPGIFFDTGKSALKPGAKNTLTKIASQLKGSDTVRIAVEGHTDNVGDDSKNQQLSEKRAEAVRDFLVNAGVPSDRISASGKGEADPVATNKTTAGRQQNRRVELVISE